MRARARVECMGKTRSHQGWVGVMMCAPRAAGVLGQHAVARVRK